MMQTPEQHHQCHSPRGNGAGGGGGGMSKLSLLSHYAAAAAVASANPHGFSLLGALEQQQHQFPPPAPPPAPLPAPHHGHPNAFQSLLQQGLVLTSAGGGQQGYNLGPPPPQLLQGFMEDLIKLSPPGSPPPNAPAYNLTLLSLLEHKTEQLQALVHSLAQASQHNGGLVQPHAAMAAARIASNISHIALAALGAQPPPSACMPETPPPLFSVATPTPAPPPPAPNPLPLVANHQPMHKNNVENQSGELVTAATGGPSPVPTPQVAAPAPTAAASAPATVTATGGMEDVDSAGGSRDEDDDGDGEELVPGSYDLVEMNAVEILAEHTHFCDKCGKGFKRDANLRMHMRGHGEQYKSPAALARPDKSLDPSVLRPRRYSCPYAGCKRNKKHRKFQPLKTVLCVKNHYRRSHCPKSLTCSKCKSKKFSVVADLKTHEKHCGRDKWQCSCGTTFSRKDKLLGHISLFQGHTPALPLNDSGNADSSTSTANEQQPSNQDVVRHPMVVGGASC